MSFVCSKKRHKTRGQAVFFQQTLPYTKSFEVYQCPHCYPYWHVSTSGLEGVHERVVEMIQAQDESCTYIRKISNKLRLYEVKYQDMAIEAIYDKKHKCIEILGWKDCG